MRAGGAGAGAGAGTLGRLLVGAAAAHPGRTALIAGDARLTYSELAALTDRYAKALLAAGANKGARVGLLVENTPEWVAAAFGAVSIGALLVPVSTYSRGDDLEFQLRHARVTHLLTSAGFLGNDYLAMLAAVRASLPALRLVGVRNGGRLLPRGTTRWDDFLAAGDDVGDDSLAAARRAVHAADDAYLLYTSGTTARPKGVLLTHDAVTANGVRIGDHQGLMPEDVVWFYFPLFFSAGCVNVLLGTLSHGAALILQDVFEPGAALGAIEAEKATAWHMWPHTLKALMSHPDWERRDHSRLHKGTGPYDLVVGAEAPDGLGGVNMYGLTETATAFSCTRADDPSAVRLRTQGFVFPGNEAKIVDPDVGSRLADGEEGEICVKGRTVMRRYHDVDPAETFDHEGFFHTGDLGSIDGDGRLRWVRRLKETIKVGGINVSPAEVEAALVRIPGVDAAYVFAVPARERGEEVGAAVVPADGARVLAADVLAHCREHLPAHKRPRDVLVLAAADVPMTGSGKVQRFALRDTLLAHGEPGSPP